VAGSLSLWSKTVLWGVNSEKNFKTNDFFLKKHDAIAKILDLGVAVLIY